jgi:hypothetical protein
VNEDGPPQTTDQPAAAPAAPSARPKGLSGFTISAMVVGSLFGCCGVTSLGGLVANRAISPAMLEASTQGMDEDMARAQRKMMQRTNELQARVFPLSMTSGLVGLLHSLALVIAAVAAQNARPSGRRMLELVCLIGLGVELINGGFGLYVAREQSGISEEMIKATFAQGADRGVAGAPDADQQRAQETARSFGAGAAKIGSILGIAMLVGFFVLKTGFYIACALYMRRKDVIAFFEHAGTRPTSAA